MTMKTRFTARLALAAGLAALAASALPVAAQQAVPVPAPRPAGTPPAAQGSTTPVNLPGQTTAPGQAQPRAPMAVPPPPGSTPAPSAARPAPQVAALPGKTQIDQSQIEAVQKVNAYFNGVRSMSGLFSQIGPDGNRTEGRFFISKPGKVRFQYAPPSVIEIISDGSSVVVRDRSLNTQDLYPLSQTPLRFLLQPNLDLMRDANVTTVYQDSDIVSVAIEEKNPLGGKARLVLVFAGVGPQFQLKQWTITDAQGLDTTVSVSDLDTATRPDDKLFRIDYMPQGNNYR